MALKLSACLFTSLLTGNCLTANSLPQVFGSDRPEKTHCLGIAHLFDDGGASVGASLFQPPAFMSQCLLIRKVNG